MPWGLRSPRPVLIQVLVMQSSLKNPLDWCKLGFLLARVASLNSHLADKRLSNEFVTAAQSSVILAIHQSGFASMSELCHAMAIGSGAMSRMLERLRLKGLITFRRSESDRRKVRIALTSTGLDLAEKIPSILLISMSDLTAPLRREELNECERILHKILAASSRADVYLPALRPRAVVKPRIV